MKRWLLAAALVPVGLTPAAWAQGFQQGFQQPSVQQMLQEGQGTPLYVDPMAIANIQQRLQQIGFYRQGNIDGIWGENTRQAVRTFQQAAGLPPTGNLTISTLAALGYNVPGAQQLAAQGLLQMPQGSFGGTGGGGFQQQFGPMGGQTFAQPGMGPVPFGQQGFPQGGMQ